MKKLSKLLVLAIFSVLLSACGGDKPEPTPAAMEEKVERSETIAETEERIERTKKELFIEEALESGFTQEEAESFYKQVVKPLDN